MKQNNDMILNRIPDHNNEDHVTKQSETRRGHPLHKFVTLFDIYVQLSQMHLMHGRRWPKRETAVS